MAVINLKDEKRIYVNGAIQDNLNLSEYTNSDIYLLIGQSNMVNGDNVANADPKYTGVIPNSKIWVTDHWEDLEAGVNGSVTNNFNSIFSLAYELNQANPTKVNYFVMVGQGGTSMQFAWKVGGTLYNEAISTFDTANATGDYNKKAIIFQQGEGDSKDESFSLDYESLQSAMIDGIKAATGINTFVDGLLGNITNSLYLYYPNVNTAKNNNLTNNKSDYVVDISDIAFDTDGVHYTASGYTEIGNRYFNIVNTLAGQGNVNNPIHRNNGNILSFTQANKEAVLFNSLSGSYTNTNEIDLSFSFKFDPTLWASTDFYTLFHVGNVGADMIRLAKWNVSNQLNLFVFQGGVSQFSGSKNLTLQDVNTITIQSGVVTVNGSQEYVGFENIPININKNLSKIGKDGVNDNISATMELLSYSYEGVDYDIQTINNTANIGDSKVFSTLGDSHVISDVFKRRNFGLIGEPLDNERVNIGGTDYALSSTVTTEIEHSGEKFYLREGLGNKVYGELGTEGAILTDNSLGVDRINYGMWQKQDNSFNWSPYTKE